MAKAFRLSKVDADKALAHVLEYKEFLGIIFIIQIIVAIWSATKFEGIITPWVATLYIVMWVGMLIVFGMKATSVDTPSQPSKISPRSWLTRTWRYLSFFFMGTLIFYALSYFGLIETGTVFIPYAWSIFIFHTVIVAPSETIAFQGILPNRIRAWAQRSGGGVKAYQGVITYTVSQSIFSIAHYATYGASITLLATAVVFGCLFLYIAENWGLASAMGIHSAWNLTVIGVIGGTSMNMIFDPSVITPLIAIIITLVIFTVVTKKIMDGNSPRIFLYLRRKENRSVS